MNCIPFYLFLKFTLINKEIHHVSRQGIILLGRHLASLFLYFDEKELALILAIALSSLARNAGVSFVAVDSFTFLDIAKLLVQLSKDLILSILLPSLPHNMLQHQSISPYHRLVLQRLRSLVVAALQHGEEGAADGAGFRAAAVAHGLDSGSARWQAV